MPFPKCVRLPEEMESSARALLDDGWREMSALEEYEWEPNGQIPFVNTGAQIRTALPSDLDRLIWIAQTSFTHDRLHEDLSVTSCEADKAKGQWVRDAFEDGRTITVAVLDDQIVGFLICEDMDEFARIDLIAVDRRHRKKGIAKQLIAAAMLRFNKPIFAGTQSSNYPAKELYLSLTFRLFQKYRTFHK